MAREPKNYFNQCVYEICTSIQTGLPMVPTLYMNLIINGILAAAQTKYQVTICAYTFMLNHFHMIFVVRNPKDASEFMRYVKGEMSHAINRLIGNPYQTSLWVEGYHAALILTPHDVLSRLMYLYLNPVKANLVSRIVEYPGLNTYKMMKSEKEEFAMTYKKVSRDAFRELPKRRLSLREQQNLAHELSQAKGINHELRVDPWAWLECFEESKEWSKISTRESLLNELTQEEASLAKQRKGAILGAQELRLQDPRRAYKPERTGKKIVCYCYIIEKRVLFIDWFKRNRDKAREVFQEWKRGNFSEYPPPGFFAPGGAILANALFFSLRL
jgi:REP element-mobilizing transposase RayT